MLELPQISRSCPRYPRWGASSPHAKEEERYLRQDKPESRKGKTELGEGKLEMGEGKVES
jgi:hypothetical protein